MIVRVGSWHCGSKLEGRINQPLNQFASFSQAGGGIEPCPYLPEWVRPNFGASPSRLEDMVRWRVADLLAERGWTTYKLVKESRLAPTVVYRIAKARRQVKRVDGKTLDALCRTLRVGPGDLLEY